MKTFLVNVSDRPGLNEIHEIKCNKSLNKIKKLLKSKTSDDLAIGLILNDIGLYDKELAYRVTTSGQLISIERVNEYMS